MLLKIGNSFWAAPWRAAAAKVSLNEGLIVSIRWHSGTVNRSSELRSELFIQESTSEGFLSGLKVYSLIKLSTSSHRRVYVKLESIFLTNRINIES